MKTPVKRCVRAHFLHRGLHIHFYTFMYADIHLFMNVINEYNCNTILFMDITFLVSMLIS